MDCRKGGWDSILLMLDFTVLEMRGMIFLGFSSSMLMLYFMVS
jgi:hypothetical protein